jgi:kumamolisin
VAPLWAGLVARINAAKGSAVGYINPTLYASPGALNDITRGNTGDFVASQGWDACTGIGSPNGSQIAQLFATGASRPVPPAMT